MSSPLAAAEAALIDGVTASGIGLYDRGLHYGDGVFDTIVVRGGQPRFAALHRARLSAGCERLHLEADIERCFAELRLVAAGHDCLVKLLVTRGDALARGYGYTGHERARRIVLRYPAPDAARDAARSQQGIAARRARNVLGENPALAGIKHLNRLEQVLARAEAPPTEVEELLVASGSGLLASGTMSNVFIVQERQLFTPAVHRCGVAGVIRAAVLREAAGLGLQASERDIPFAALDEATEIFVTNARIGIWPVRELDGRALVIGATTRALQAHLGQLDA